MNNAEQLWWALGYCAFMLILAYVIRTKPPKQINHIYGYRTSRSMKNKQTWDTANKFSSELMLRFCVYSFFLPVIGYVLIPNWNLLFTIVGNTILIFLVIYYTEKYLRQHFDKEGNQIH